MKYTGSKSIIEWRHFEMLDPYSRAFLRFKEEQGEVIIVGSPSKKKKKKSKTNVRRRKKK